MEFGVRGSTFDVRDLRFGVPANDGQMRSMAMEVAFAAPGSARRRRRDGELGQLAAPEIPISSLLPLCDANLGLKRMKNV